ncbi:hypothetical protein [Ignatzschineria indica]|uniref:hypothetical protein n=1 Tax=Ignatzschineria indica TaxID=472583 RepID=UPI003F4A9BF8
MKENLIIIEKYNRFVNYVYNPLINTNRKHKVARDALLQAISEQYRLFHYAVKSNQKSRIYDADAGLSYIRSLMRLLIHNKNDRRCFTLKQISVAESLLAEVGAILGSMLK